MPSLTHQPTFAEVDDLIAAKDATIKAIDAEGVKTMVAWKARDATAANAWFNEWVALIARYNKARALRLQPPSGTPIPPEVIWSAILKALRQAWDATGSTTQTPPESPGDLSDLSRRLSAEGARPDFSNVPQPTATDAEIALFKAADMLFNVGTGIAGGLVLFGILWLVDKAKSR